jgi:hypothetical protein
MSSCWLTKRPYATTRGGEFVAQPTVSVSAMRDMKVPAMLTAAQAVLLKFVANVVSLQFTFLFISALLVGIHTEY